MKENGSEDCQRREHGGGRRGWVVQLAFASKW